jgi:hypothetical protein
MSHRGMMGEWLRKGKFVLCGARASGMSRVHARRLEGWSTHGEASIGTCFGLSVLRTALLLSNKRAEKGRPASNGERVVTSRHTQYTPQCHVRPDMFGSRNTSSRPIIAHAVCCCWLLRSAVDRLHPGHTGGRMDHYRVQPFDDQGGQM